MTPATTSEASDTETLPAERKAKRLGQSKRTPEMVDEVLRRLSAGEPLTRICKDVGIHPTTWGNWCSDDSALEVAHGRARDLGHDALAAECLAIADDGSRDAVTDEDGKERPNTEWIQRSKLRVETRLKLLACWDPRRYGAKVEVDAKHEHRVSPLEQLRTIEAQRQANGRVITETSGETVVRAALEHRDRQQAEADDEGDS